MINLFHCRSMYLLWHVNIGALCVLIVLMSLSVINIVGLDIFSYMNFCHCMNIMVQSLTYSCPSKVCASLCLTSLALPSYCCWLVIVVNYCL